MERVAEPRFRATIDSLDELAGVYGPSDFSEKVIDRLDEHCRTFIACSPFVLVGTSNASGRCDVSPKGGPPGFVKVLDEQRLAIPDAPGNRLIDSLRNLITNQHVGLLFLIPGMDETLRVNGRAVLTRDADVLQFVQSDPKPPKVAIGVEVEEAFLHCAKAFKRSALWRPEEWQGAEGLARPAQIWRDHLAAQDLTTERLQEIVDDDYTNNLRWG